MTAGQVTVLVAVAAITAAPLALPESWTSAVPLAWTAMSLAAALLLWLPDLARGRWTRTQVDLALAVYLAIVLATSLASVNPPQTFVFVLRLIAVVALFYGTATVARKTPSATVWVLAAVFVAAVLSELMAGAWHVTIGLAMRPKEYPIPAGWSGYPELGVLAVVQFALAVAGLATARRVQWVIAAAALTALSTVEIVFLFSRKAWLSVVAILLLAGALALVRRQVGRLAAIAVTMAALGGVLYATVPTFQYLVRSFAGPVTGMNVTVEVAAPESRLTLWRETVRMIAAHPLTGVGLGNFRPTFESTYNPQLNNDLRRGVNAHNLWLHEAAETGVAGAIALAAVWAIVLWCAWRDARAAPGVVSFGVLFALVGLASANLVDVMPRAVAGARLDALTWILFGLAAAECHCGEPTTAPASQPM